MITTQIIYDYIYKMKQASQILNLKGMINSLQHLLSIKNKI
jgi:hypothetical protein